MLFLQHISEKTISSYKWKSDIKAKFYCQVDDECLDENT